MIKLVCLDVAGTTVTDDGTVLSAFDRALIHQGIVGEELEEARLVAIQTMGQSKVDVFRQILPDPSAIEVAIEVFESSYLESVEAGRVVAASGALDTITGMKRAGLLISFITGFSTSTRDAVLRATGLMSLADLAVSPSDAGRGRPYPDMILHAVTKLAVDDVRQVAVVGDNPDDLLAGYRAGASIVAGVLSGTSSRGRLSSVPHTHIIDSIADLPAILDAS